jgi:hypothetical protein
MKASVTARLATVGAILVLPLSGCGFADLVSGKETCQAWGTNKKAGSTARKMDAAWAQAIFKSFYGALEKNQNLKARGVNLQRDDKRLLSDMDDYCAAHPEATVKQAAQATAFRETGVGALPEQTGG